MDFNEIRKQSETILQELRAKCPAELSLLVESLSMMQGIMFELGNALIQQNKQQIEQNERLSASIESLQSTIKELRRQLGQNSNNSSKPPSSDGYRKPKPKSLREKSGKKPGGQKGHSGVHMSVPHKADKVEQHIPAKCSTCPNLSCCIASGKVFACGEKRYVVEALVTTMVIEHQSLKAVACPNGEKKLKGEFPENVKAYVQYGNSFTVMAGLLSTTGAVSLNRIQTLLRAMFDISLSQGTISSMVERCATMVSPVMEQVKEYLKNTDRANFDETGVRTKGKLYWVHNSSNDKFTYQTINKKRGSEGIEANGIASSFKGIAVHDCWSSYWNFDNIGKHAVCGAHLLRELNGVIDNEKDHSWAERFKKLLLDMKKSKETAIAKGLKELEKQILEKFDRKYDLIMYLANKECPPPAPIEKKGRGRIKKGKTRSLIERLVKLKDSVCLFIKDFAAPFDNNLAERDLRNIKTKSKVSGCFRSENGAQNYLTVMSYLGTARKHGINSFQALTEAFKGNSQIILG